MRYEFESANMGTIDFCTVGEWVGNRYDFAVSIWDTGVTHDFYEIDGGSVEEMFEWLIGQDVKFESKRSLWFNVHYVASVMIDKELTQSQLLDKAVCLTEEELDKWLEYADLEEGVMNREDECIDVRQPANRRLTHEGRK